MTDPVPLLADDTFVIFLFHGVIRRQRHRVRNYTRKHVELDEFVVFLRAARAAGQPVSLPQIVEASRRRETLPPRSFAITFDDGFGNNASIAAPALADEAIPATFYVTTDFIEAGTLSWTDRIEQAVEAVSVVRLDDRFGALEGCYETLEDKRALLDLVRARVKGDAAIDPYAFAAELCARLGVSELPPDPELDAKMSWEQVRQLAASPLFTVGGHGHTHRVLAHLRTAELEVELGTSLRLLRGRLGRQVQHYSYPEGLDGHYSEAVIEALRRHGVVCAPTANAGVNRVGDSLFHLKRVTVA